MAMVENMFRDSNESPELCIDERALSGLLGHRYGDGLVYMQGSSDRLLFRQALRLGLVNEEGYLTPSGYRFWRKRES